MSDEKSKSEQVRQSGFYYYDAVPRGSLYDPRTQSEILTQIMLRPRMLLENFGDLTATDFGGEVHSTLFRAMLKLAEDGIDFDPFQLAEEWGKQKGGGNEAVGDALAYINDILDGSVPLPVTNVRARVEKLHRLSHLRRIQFLGASIQRHAEGAEADPETLLQKLEFALESIRDGYDLNGDLLPYAPRNLARRPDLITLSDVEAKPVPWLWRPYLPYGMLSLLSGEPGCGKTFIALAFAAALTVGRVPFTGEPCHPHDVVYLSIENSLEFCIRPRFDTLEGDARRFHALQGAVTGDGPKARREGVRLSDVPLLESAIKQSGAKFLVVDPIQSFLGAEVDSHRSNETRPILDGLKTLAEKYGVCLLILRHFAKSATGSAINRGLGSIDITGAARTELHAGKHDEQRVLAHAKSNIGPFGTSLGYEIAQDIFRWTGESSLTADDLAQSAGGGSAEDREATNDATNYLEDVLKRGPGLASEILVKAKDEGFPERTLRRAKAKLGVKSRRREGGRYGQYEWYLDGFEGAEEVVN